MFRKLIVSAATIIVTGLLITGAVWAAPEKLTGEEKSTAALVELSKPEEDFSTFSDSCIVSGKSEQGVKLYIYIKPDNQNTYEKLKVDDKQVSWTVGVSGIFAKEIGLERDKVNKILIYAEKESEFQIIKRAITVKNLAVKEVLKNEVIKIEEIITKILSN
ncbi:MAG: hypothetical protein ACM3KR_01575 [Deltaproteobacteria bacterium]